VLDVIIIHLAGAPRWRVLSEVPLFRITVLISIRGMMLGDFGGVLLLGRLLEFPEDHAGGVRVLHAEAPEDLIHPVLKVEGTPFELTFRDEAAFIATQAVPMVTDSLFNRPQGAFIRFCVDIFAEKGALRKDILGDRPHRYHGENPAILGLLRDGWDARVGHYDISCCYSLVDVEIIPSTLHRMFEGRVCLSLIHVVCSLRCCPIKGTLIK